MRMPLKSEGQQMPQLFPVPVVHHGARHFHIILIGARGEGIGVLPELFRAGHELGPGKVEKRITVVKERCVRMGGTAIVISSAQKPQLIPLLEHDPAL